MNKIPSYALYGEAVAPIWHDSLHVESISLRSGAYNWEIAAHRHDGLLQMLYLQSGEGEVLLDNQRVEVKAPCLLYIPEQIVHGFAWHGRVEGHVITAVQHPLESIVQVLSPGLLPQIQKACVVALPHWEPADNPLEPLYRALYGEYHGRGREHTACSMSLLLALLIQMLRLSEYTHDLHAHRHDRRSQQVIAFRELVNRHFREHLSLHDYANSLGITVVTLGRLCHEQLGMTPMTLINARLILEAKRELAHSAQSVKQIAHGIGFSDVGYFSRFFRKHAQRSPSEFRLQAQAQATRH